MPNPYRDHLALLEDHLTRLEMVLRAHIVLRRQHALEIGGGNMLAIPDIEAVDAEALLHDAGELEADIAARSQVTPPEGFPLIDLCQRFSLDSVERDVVLLALAPSLRLEFGRYYGLLKDSPMKGQLDVDLILGLISDTTSERIKNRRYFNSESRLLKNHLISLDRHRIEMGDSFLTLGIRLPVRVLTWMLGDDNLDESLQGFTQLLEPDVDWEQVVLNPAVEGSVRTMVGNHNEYMQTLSTWELDKTISYGRGVVLLFVGAPGTGKTMTAKAIAKELGKRLLLVDPQQVYDLKRPIEDNLSELFREARLQNAIVFFDECEAIFQHRLQGNPHLSLILSAIEHYDGIIIMSTNTPGLLDPALDRRVLFRVVFEAPSLNLRKRIWEVHLSGKVNLADDVDLGLLARQFDFSGGYIKNAVLVAINRALSRPIRPVQLTHEDLEVAARTQLRARLSEYAENEITPLRITDLVLPEETAAQVNDILAAAQSRSIVFQEWGFGAKMNKGKGLSALFDGEPGTGKTLCAEILAAELGLTLYRINVANVVSKYIGETEKNLTRIFKEADDSHCLLLFDEADSLFSQRTEVKSVQDKYANMEINVLLQLMERYEGLVLLTTNLKKGIDKAFERRLSFKVHFPFPEPEYREAIWRHLIPETAPIDGDIDWWAMAKGFELSGGSIKNAIVRGAYRAAAHERPISMDDLVNAAKYECQAAGKLYRIYTPDDF